jgi:O-antigen ligase
MQIESFLYSFDNQFTQKRILGIAGNPNNNAIIFSFFLIFFFVLSEKIKFNKKQNIFFFVISLIFILLTGSRTTFISDILLIIFFLFIEKKIKLNYLIYYIAIIVLTFRLSAFVNISYIKSLWEIDLTETGSFIKRLEIWDMLLSMIKESLIAGYGPNKNFFYENNIYAENEYIFILWKYGIVGFILHYLFILIQIFNSLKYKNLFFPKVLFGFSIIILLTSLTNAPLSDMKINEIFSVLIALSYKEINLYRGKK